MTRLPSLSDKAVLLPTSLQVYPIHIPHVLHLFFLLASLRLLTLIHSLSFSLIISTGHPHKNLTALSDIFVENPDHLFVVVGPGLISTFDLVLPNVIFKSNLSNLELHALYQYVDCFLCPSTLRVWV